MKTFALCVDPGITTGWALLDEAGNVHATSVWGTAELKVSLDLLIRQVFSAGHNVRVIIEKMPNTGAMGALGQKLEAVRRDILGIVTDVYELPIVYVLPGTWKNSRVAKTSPQVWKFGGSPTMIHQRDAIRMGRYQLDKETR